MQIGPNSGLSVVFAWAKGGEGEERQKTKSHTAARKFKTLKHESDHLKPLEGPKMEIRNVETS